MRTFAAESQFPMFDLAQIGKAFLILFAVIDIVGGIPLILDVRKNAGKIYPARATIVSMVIMIVFLLSLIHISEPTRPY